MFVVRVADFLTMSAARPHQHLLKDGLVSEFRGGGGHGRCAVFVSHQWCATRHPDPHFRQLAVLQRIFERAAAGTLRVEPDVKSAFLFRSTPSARPHEFVGARSWYMWYDYFSVPQLDVVPCSSPDYDDLAAAMGDAISSLSAYVLHCAYFLALAPSVQHEDGHFVNYISWKARGWCRFERLSRALSYSDTRMFVVQREDSIVEHGAHDYVFDPVLEGEFTVEGDKARLAEVVRRLLQDKLANLLDEGREVDYRHMAAWSAVLFGSERCVWQEFSVSASALRVGDGGFLRALRLQSPWEERGGTTALLLAARAGDVRAIEVCLDAGASMLCVERKEVPSLYIQKGTGALQAAAWHGHVAATRLLLERRADARWRNRSTGGTALHAASVMGKPPLLRILLEHRAELEAQSRLGITALDIAAIFGRPAGVASLLAARASLRRATSSTLHTATLFSAGSAVVRTLLEARSAVNAPMLLRPTIKGHAVMLAVGFSYQLGQRGFFRALCYHARGATPLMLAVMTGSMEEVEVLLEFRADATVHNARGATALSLAWQFRTMEGNPLLRV